MGTNVGKADRAFRIIIGVALITFAIYGTWSYAYLGWIGVIPIVTALVGWCPAYRLLGLSTCPLNKT